MADRSRFFDDLAGIAGGALSALAGLREEVEGMVRSGVDEALARFDLVRRADLDAVEELARAAREGEAAATARLAAIEVRLAALEIRLSRDEAGTADPPG